MRLILCSLTLLLVAAAIAEKPAEQRAIKYWQQRKDILQGQLNKCFPNCSDELKQNYSAATLAFNQALNVGLGIRPKTSHPIICPRHGKVYMTEYEYVEFLGNGPIQCLTAALAHQVNPKVNKDPGKCHFDIHCPICGRVSENRNGED
jgi:hypothetical protein